MYVTKDMHITNVVHYYIHYANVLHLITLLSDVVQDFMLSDLENLAVGWHTFIVKIGK